MTTESNNEQMEFPDTWEEFEEYYGFYDTNEVYTNKSRLIPSFRVKQWLEHHKKEPCGDCIERKTVMECFVKARKTTPFCDEQQKIAKELIEQLPSVTPQLNKWIPIKTALPEVGIDVLICDIEGTIYLSHRSSFDYYFDEWGNKIKNIRAWMPLPEPYKAEGSEE